MLMLFVSRISKVPLLGTFLVLSEPLCLPVVPREARAHSIASAFSFSFAFVYKNKNTKALFSQTKFWSMIRRSRLFSSRLVAVFGEKHSTDIQHEAVDCA